MNTLIREHRWPALLLPAVFLLLSPFVQGHEVDEKLPFPGFRPPSDYMADFIAALDSADVVVLPTLLRRPERTSHSFASRDQLVAALNEHDLLAAKKGQKRIDRKRLARRSQWEIFQWTLVDVAELAKRGSIDADYLMVMEIILPTGDDVFGIEVYIVDRDGNNAFSFLLNSHHQSFVDAKLVATDSSEAARDAMISSATGLAASALAAQIELAKACVERMARPAERPAAGVIDDFESDAFHVTLPYGVELGYVAFGDEKTDSRITVTDRHPPRPGESAGNHVLELSLDVSDWGGFARSWTNAARDEWLPMDWRDFDGVSFWLYGNATGTNMTVHIMDNRSPCSLVEDAERYGFDFTDDFSGWKQFRIAFAELERKEVFNDAPNDGLGLERVHGWAIATGPTDGRLTFYVDDFALWREDDGQ